MNKIKEYCYSSPLYSAIVVALAAVALFSLPNAIGLGENAMFALNAVARVLVAVLAIVCAKACGFSLFGARKTAFSETVLLILGFLVCANNFPVVGFITGGVRLTENAKIARYLIYCASVGAAEEFVFRGLVLPLTELKFKNSRNPVFFALAVSSAIFALCHAFNVFSAGVGATALQVGYTFLTGGLFGAAFIITGNILVPIVLHTVFDIGGLIFTLPFGIAIGNQWDTLTVIITAVLGVAATAAFVFKFARAENRKNQK